MHGIIFSELKKYADARLGTQGWMRVLQQGGLSPRVYLPTKEYPDEEAGRIVTAAAAVTGLAVPVVLEDFGAFIVPDLLRLYAAVIDPAWRTLDVIQHTEGAIHRVVRLRDAAARPPELAITRSAPHQVVIIYRSARRMCGVARGIVRGLAANFGESVEVSESRCMLDGAAECSIEVQLSSARSDG